MADKAPAVSPEEGKILHLSAIVAIDRPGGLASAEGQQPQIVAYRLPE